VGTPEEKSLGMFATNIKLGAGDVITFTSNGGGGYGNPLERDPEPILQEVIDGFMTIEKARDVYGVVVQAVDPDLHDYRIDVAATAKLRVGMEGRELEEGYGPGQVHPDGKRTGELLSQALRKPG
jgi:N-methylhydantoinase B